MKLLLILIVLLFDNCVQAQNDFTGRQYIGEGIPLRWFFLETDSTGTFYSKGDVGYTELIATPVIWTQVDSNSINLTILYDNSPETLNLSQNPHRDYLQDLEKLTIFHRRIYIELDGKIYKE